VVLQLRRGIVGERCAGVGAAELVEAGEGGVEVVVFEPLDALHPAGVVDEPDACIAHSKGKPPAVVVLVTLVPRAPAPLSAAC
jgi:hypothetical protein